MSKSREPSGTTPLGRSKVRTRSDPSWPVAPMTTQRSRAPPLRRSSATGRGRSGRYRERDEVVEMSNVERLRDVREHAAAQRLGRGLGVRVGGDHDDGHAHAETPNLLQELEAAHARHVHVEQDEIELSAQQNDERLGAVLRRFGLVRMRVAELSEEVPQNFDYRRLVVDDQDSLGHARQYMTPSGKFTIGLPGGHGWARTPCAASPLPMARER